MRLRHPDGTTVHLAYCTNVHPAEDLAGVLGQLDRYAVPVGERLGVDVLGLGLWLAAPVAAGLAADPDARRRLRHELGVRGLETVTLNGFPYQAFHAPVVKHQVYHPDWTDERRLAYTTDLVTVLADLLPDDALRGSISTLPLAWREPWSPDRMTEARARLDELAQTLHRVGRIRVALEPEPGCVVDRVDQAAPLLSTLDTRVLGICLDLAHLACSWEDPSESVDLLATAGVPIVKVQVSAALEIADPQQARDVVTGYAEPRFLHQTRTAAGLAFDDLPEALAADPSGPWRVHFHAPLHAEPLPPLETTTGVLGKALAAVMAAPACDHLEVETYTWGVLPEAARPTDDAGLADGIAAELAYARDQLRTLGVS